MEGTPLYPLFVRGEIRLLSPLKKWCKNYLPLFVRGGQGVFSRLHFAQTEGTPLYPLFKRGEIRLLFPSYKVREKTIPTLRKRGNFSIPPSS